MLKTKVAVASLVSLSLIGLAGCGSISNTTSNASAPTAKTVAEKKPVVTKPSTATQIVAALKKSSLPVGKTDVYTASNDPNHLLGRPGEYTSKVNFIDTRVKEAVSGGIEISNGGSIEVFPNTTSAKKRYTYISSIAQSAPMFEEYDYLDGKVLMRISDDLTPTQEKQYVADLKKILG
ncbi:hypothetical protein [Alicyclobacillus fastidiosus]|uniref:Lipoprotein n=1 Tax=Alicyclobacillus fastidiosus TaxID=392011 RepID=A0ABV5AKA9_9BACL|nr:hypothetical protein [Alicyclobacillus fastidiosus]WEH09313.1 hypothetical protein PYS47_21995 [Alicyclobacillus fastidiosus]